MRKQAFSMLQSEVVTVAIGRVGRLEAAGEAAWTRTLNKAIARVARLSLLGHGSCYQDPDKDGRTQAVPYAARSRCSASVAHHHKALGALQRSVVMTTHFALALIKFEALIKL